MIDQEEITTIKQGVELVPFMRSCGIELKQVGKSYRGYCPFHEDTSPSLTVNPKENLWNCFGCDKGGDNIRFVQLYDNVSFGAAVERLKKYFPGSDLPNPEHSKQPTTPKIKQRIRLDPVSAANQDLTLFVMCSGRGSILFTLLFSLTALSGLALSIVLPYSEKSILLRDGGCFKNSSFGGEGSSEYNRANIMMTKPGPGQ